ncbi:hypothetical protein HB807_10460 [Listeria welshimeri]|nr:hypothetical protein [Listeria welshimeri]
MFYEKNIDNLKLMWEEKGYDCEPYSDKEITDVIKRIGKLPMILVEYYKKIGIIDGQEEHSLSVLPLDELCIVKNGDEDFLIYATEMEGACDYAISLKDIEKDNPVIYCSGEGYSEFNSDPDMNYIIGTDDALDKSAYNNTSSLLASFWMFLTNEVEEEFDFEAE